MTHFIWYLSKPSQVLRIALAYTLQGPCLALASFLTPVQMQDSSMQSFAYPLLLCSAVSTRGWVLIGVVCPIWESKSCTKGYLRNFPLSSWDLILKHFCPLSLTVLFNLYLRSANGLSPLLFSLLQQWPIPAAPLAFPGTQQALQDCSNALSRMQHSSMDGLGLEECRRPQKRKPVLEEERLCFVFKSSSILCQLNWF